MYVRERDSGMYDIWVYATTKLIAETPIMALVPAITLIMIYFSIGLRDSFSEFVEYYVLIFMVIQASTAMGYTLSSAFNHAGTATAFAPIVNMPLSILGGFMLNLNGIF